MWWGGGGHCSNGLSARVGWAGLKRRPACPILRRWSEAVIRSHNGIHDGGHATGYQEYREAKPAEVDDGMC
jgi:hypothetical protein